MKRTNKLNFLGRSMAFFLVLICGLNLYAQNPKFTQVAKNDCGVEGKQPFLVRGDNYKLPKDIKGSEAAVTSNYGSNVIYAFDQVDKESQYQLEVVYLSDSDREQQIVADGNVIHGPVKLEAGKEQRYIIDLPPKAHAYAQLVLTFEEVGNGPNAIVSEVNLYSSNPQLPIPFEGERKIELYNMPSFTVDTNVDVEKVLPTYVPIPTKMKGVYQASMSLDGIWKFNVKASDNFYKTDATSADWKPIVVPGQWSMQGFTVDSLGYAAYQRDINIPQDWKGKNIRIRFDGVYSESEIYVNDTKVGEHMGGMTAFEVDVTAALVPGKNRLSVKVRSESLADMLGSLTQYAAHQLGGITRKVTLFAVPEAYVSDIRIDTDLDDNYVDAELKTYVTITNASDKVQKDLSLKIDVEGAELLLRHNIPAIAPKSSWSGWVTGTVKNPKKWDTEHPNLYRMRVDLSDKGVITEQIRKKIGFREIKVVGNQVLVNGKAVKLAGVCRHEVHPLTGRVLTEELQREDVELYKKANVNFIRTSHYPPGEELLEIADELGMFIEVESPVCWVGHHANENWQTLNYRDDKYYDYVLQANMETIHFYRNHPSLLFWSMANESYWNKNFAQVYEYVKKADTTRPAAFHDQAYGGFNNQGSNTGIANIHYPGPGGYKHAEKSIRPMVYGEYCHLNVYNRSELVTDPGVRSDWAYALQEAWEGMYATQGVLGGSIWSGIDDVFQLPNGDAVGYGPWGPIDGWRRPKPEYYDMKKLYSPIRVNTENLTPSNEFVLDLENRYTFTNFNEVKIDWKFGDETGVLQLDMAPKTNGKATIRVNNPNAAEELYISFTDPRGFVADEYVIPVGKQMRNELPTLDALSTKVKERKDKYVITGKGFEAEISRTTGQILSMKKNKKTVINGGPLLMALPLTGDGCYPDHNAKTPIFNDVCTDWKMASMDVNKENNNVVVTVKGSYKEFAGECTMTINANGEFTTDYSFKALEGVNPRQWGLVFETPKGYDTTFWRRDANWSVYPDDHISRPEGEAALFYEAVPTEVDPRIEPTWAWSKDYNELGSSDFRSTRRDVWYAGLKDKDASSVTVKSDGTQSWRSWLNGDKIQFIVADFVSPGYEMFLGSYYEKYRKPIKEGDVISGKVTLRVQ